MSSNRFLVGGDRRFVEAIISSAGVDDANKIVATNSDGRIDNSFIEGAGFYTRSVNPPGAPFLGLTWEEINADGSPRYGWVWAWDGTYWRSPDFYWEGSANNTSGGHFFFFRANNNFNFYFKELATTTFGTSVHNSTNHYTFDLRRRIANNTPTNISSLSTQGNAGNIWIRQSATINTHINVESTSCLIFTVDIARIGSPAAVSYNFQVVYNLVRI